MPLVTDNINEARVAYTSMEARALSAENLAQSLQSELDRLRAGQALGPKQVIDLRQLVLNREADNSRLRIQLQEAVQTRADLALENLIASMGMAAALGEATMPDRVVPTMSVTFQSYVVPTESSVGLRFFQPGIDASPRSLSSTSFEIAKVPPAAGDPAPRNLYTVLLEKQALYSDPSWAQFKSASAPPSQPATDIVVALTQVLANAGDWSFPYLLQSAAAVGNLEKTLAGLIAAAKPTATAAAYRAAVDSLLALTAALGNKPVPVAGDLLALTASLDTVTRVARTLIS